jgi:alginate O-acetyltransferase complex protein AlgJ
MKKRSFLRLTCASALASVCGTPYAAKTIAVNQYDTIIFGGKNEDWLFASWEMPNSGDIANVKITVDLLTQAIRLLEARGIATALVIVPYKIRVYEDLLPPDIPMSAGFRDIYSNAIKGLHEAGVNAIDLNTPFLASPDRMSDTPLYLRQDSHWSPTGAMLAAQLIRASIDADAKLKAAWAATPEVQCALEQHKKKTASRQRNMVKRLPESAGRFELEKEQGFDVKCQASQAGLTGDGDTVGITLIGSSASDPVHGLPDALRYTLQRNFLTLSQPGQGSWAGMLEYLSADAFKKNPPKLMIWEISEILLTNPPNSKWRDQRYQMSNGEWLTRMKALLQ